MMKIGLDYSLSAPHNAVLEDQVVHSLPGCTALIFSLWYIRHFHSGVQTDKSTFHTADLSPIMQHKPVLQSALLMLNLYHLCRYYVNCIPANLHLLYNP